jgi:hypothetical protein
MTATRPRLPANTLRFIATHGLRAERIDSHPVHNRTGWILRGNPRSMFFECVIDEDTKFPEVPEKKS